MGNLTKDFSRKEFACPCCGKDNIHHKLVETVQAIRDAVGAPVIVNSGVRCQKYNDSLKGSVPNSSHITGLAADIYVKGWSNSKFGALIKQLYNENKLPHLKYCYKIKGDTNTAVHVDIDASKRRSKVFGF